MTKATKVGLGIFGLLIVAGLIISAMSPAMPMHPVGPLILGVTSSASSSTVSNPSSLPVLADQMPPFSGITQWYNTPNDQPLTPAELKGKVVLVDFWTYSCINCIRTLPYVKAMWAKYAADGLVIVGVHTPEFAFEADPKNVGAAVQNDGILYPVALDANYATWNNYNNQYWPAEYLFDRQGRLRATHFGEGDYDTSEANIRSLLAEGTSTNLGAMADVAAPDLSKIETQETYFGLNRGDAFMGTAGPSGQTVTLTAASPVDPDKWTAGGEWAFYPEYIETETTNDVFRFSVQADKLHIVMDSSDGTNKTVQVYVDGVKQPDVSVNMSQLYTPATFPDAKRHTVELRFPDAGVRLYSATFS